MPEKQYRIWLIGELEDDLVDFNEMVQPTAEEKARFADWPPSGDGFSFHRLKRAWEGHPKGALVAWDGQSVLLIAY
jgi:hypothetical protein